MQSPLDPIAATIFSAAGEAQSLAPDHGRAVLALREVITHVPPTQDRADPVLDEARVDRTERLKVGPPHRQSPRRSEAAGAAGAGADGWLAAAASDKDQSTEDHEKFAHGRYSVIPRRFVTESR
ncbi:hypothetical protein QRX50_22365 [Amycolatopsis carbonis]|uniref:Uncharacterized protein n=1 Tax=Amycolatopsis carbonis TaxID=715471 RepID=A0A9Y2MYB7_9PSEU|nr:hypothetical protein [Amycolatopsis sp. 2-15]WIX83306.1 hypothetical protein QRX50_22365 [Amycolatopsis sp. 2-15]